MEPDEIQTEGTRSYRVKALPKETGGYRLDMLLENGIPGILPVREREKNGRLALAFEISGWTSLAGYCETNRLRARELTSLVHGIGDILQEAEEYLLEPDCFLLNAKEIYLTKAEDERLELGLVCMPVPQENWRAQMKELFRYLLEKIDYREEKGVQMAYELYELMNSQEFIPFASLMGCVDRFWEETREEENREASLILKEQEALLRSNVSRLKEAGETGAKQGLLPPKAREFLTVKVPAVLGYVLPAIAGVLLWYHWFGQ